MSKSASEFPAFSKISLICLAIGLSGCVTTPKEARNVLYTDQSFEVEVTECRVPGGSQKSLILLPPTGGTNIIDRSYMKRFCNSGWDVYLLNNWSHPEEKGDDLEFHQHAYTNSQRAIGVTLERIKTPYIGLLGTSLGATYASVAANTFEKLNGVFMIVGGLPIPRVIVTSDQVGMQALHKSRFERFKFANDGDYESAINKVFHLEPTQLGDMHLKKDIGVVVALNDTTVPYATQKNLIEFFKPRTVIELSSSHFWAIVKTWLFHTGELVQFFDESAARALTPSK
jgi:hypothetical protein